MAGGSNLFYCFRSRNLESLIYDWISEQPLRNEANLNQVAEKCYEETWNRPKIVLGTCKTSAQSSQ